MFARQCMFSRKNKRVPVKLAAPSSIFTHEIKTMTRTEKIYLQIQKVNH